MTNSVPLGAIVVTPSDATVISQKFVAEPLLSLCVNLKQPPLASLISKALSGAVVFIPARLSALKMKMSSTALKLNEMRLLVLLEETLT
jgi:hypothetical protein